MQSKSSWILIHTFASIFSRYPFHHFYHRTLKENAIEALNATVGCHHQRWRRSQDPLQGMQILDQSWWEWIVSKSGDSSTNMEHFHSTCFHSLLHFTPCPDTFASISDSCSQEISLRSERSLKGHSGDSAHTMVGAAKEVSVTKKNQDQHQLNLNPCHRWKEKDTGKQLQAIFKSVCPKEDQCCAPPDPKPKTRQDVGTNHNSEGRVHLGFEKSASWEKGEDKACARGKIVSLQKAATAARQQQQQQEQQQQQQQQLQQQQQQQRQQPQPQPQPQPQSQSQNTTRTRSRRRQETVTILTNHNTPQRPQQPTGKTQNKPGGTNHETTTNSGP